MTKISFLDAANHLEQICDKVDSIDEIDKEIEGLFTEATSDLSESVDRRIYFIKYAESQIIAAKKMREEWDSRVKRFEAMIIKIKQSTIETMKAFPNLPYKGETGSFRIQKNSVPSIRIWDEGIIPEDYYIISRAVSRALIKGAIDAGFNVDGVSVEYGEHLRIGLK